MRAERFGSYWIESTLAGTPSLFRQGSRSFPRRTGPFMAAAAMPGMCIRQPVIVAAARAVDGAQQAFFRLGACRRQLGKIADARPATPGSNRLIATYTHDRVAFAAILRFASANDFRSWSWWTIRRSRCDARDRASQWPSSSLSYVRCETSSGGASPCG